MKSVVIITAADSKFFDLVQGTVLSIRGKEQGKSVEIGFFDLGCTPEQVDWLSKHVNYIVEPDWNYNFAGVESVPSYLRGLLARPQLRRYFPDYEVYIWIDADAWVQDWFGIDLLIQGSKKRGLAIVPEIDRGNRLLYGPKDYLIDLSEAYRYHFPSLSVEDLHTYPLLNAGVFAISYTAKHWDLWDFRLSQALARRPSIITDQLALNVAVYLDGLLKETELLPAYCNWTCHYGLPKWDPRQNLLVEPYLPHTPISIIHLTSHSKREGRHVLLTTEDEKIEMSLKFSDASLEHQKQSLTPASAEQLSFTTLGIYLSQINLALFPDWDPNLRESVTASLEPLLKFILLSSNPQHYALIVSAEPDYGMAESVLEAAAANVTIELMDLGHELSVEPSISLVKTLNSEQWKRLLARVDYHYPLTHGRIPAGIQPALDKLPRFEFPTG